MTPKSFTSQPLYVQLREVLIGRIASGHWKAGDMIPNEIELSREFGLSPGTVRKALEWMEEAKILARRQGRGTFVRDPSSEEFVNWYERLRAEDGSPVRDGIVEAEVVEVEADAFECTRLHLEPGAIVRRTRRVRTEDGRPYMIEKSSVPTALFPLPPEQTGKDIPLLALSKMCGVILGGGEERISATIAGPEFAAQFNCDPSEPLLRLDRVVYTISGQPAKWRVGHCKLSDKYYSAAIGPEHS